MPPALAREVCPPVHRGRFLLNLVNGAMAMLLCVGAISIAAMLSGELSDSRHAHHSGNERASLTVRKYAFEAYPAWAADHRDRACPDKLIELNVYMNTEWDIDPWGRRYQFACGPSVRGLWVRSAGEDGVFDTEDDPRSDR